MYNYFRYRKGAKMQLQDLKTQFLNYMKYRHLYVQVRWTTDDASFKRLGYDVQRIHICKECGQCANTECCSSYNPANRSKKYVITNLEFVEDCIPY